MYHIDDIPAHLRPYFKPAPQIGLEPTPEAFIAAMVAVFREVRRVLRDDGTLWMNLGDSYASSGRSDRKESPGVGAKQEMKAPGRDLIWESGGGHNFSWYIPAPGGGKIKPKDLCGIPWRVALALQADGWYLRSDIIWHKPAPMPESVTDRPTRAHEYLFLLTKSERYFYDAEAVAEPTNPVSIARASRGVGVDHKNIDGAAGQTKHSLHQAREHGYGYPIGGTRNRRTVWTIASEPFAGAHFATYPTKLVEPCVKAGSSERGCCPECGAPWSRIVSRSKVMRERPNALTKRDGSDGQGNVCPNDVAGVETRTLGWEPGCDCSCEPVPCRVLDPFSGSGTTAGVACLLGRDGHGIELNPEYAAMSRERIAGMLRPSTARVDRGEESPLFAR